MSQVQFLIDENLPLSLVAGIRRAEPGINVWRVGQTNMPSFGCDDRMLLAFCEHAQRLLVSLDRASMPNSVEAHVTTGGHTWGVLLITRRCLFRTLIDDLLLIWSASQAEEWRDTLHYLPL